MKFLEKNRYGSSSICVRIQDENNDKQLSYWVHQTHHIHSYLYERILSDTKNSHFMGFITSLDINLPIIKSLEIYKDLEIAEFQNQGDFVFWDINYNDINQIIFWTLKDQLYQYLKQKDENYENLDTDFIPPMGEVNSHIEKINDLIKGLFKNRSFSIEIY